MASCRGGERRFEDILILICSRRGSPKAELGAVNFRPSAPAFPSDHPSSTRTGLGGDGLLVPPAGGPAPSDTVEALPPDAFLLQPQALEFPETKANELTIAMRRRDLFRLSFRQVHKVARAWQALKEEGGRRGYRCLESQGDGELATLFFYRGR